MRPSDGPSSDGPAGPNGSNGPSGPRNGSAALAGAPAGGEERQGLRPRYRRAFGCVTWVYMGILAFLAVATLLAFPLRYFGDGTGFGQVLSLLSFFGLFLMLPAMIMAFFLGSRTYRVEGILGRRAGATVGAIAGWTCFFFLCWSAVAYGFGGRDQLFRPAIFGGLESSFVLYLFPLPVLAATALVIYALYYTGADFARRRRAVLLAGALVLLAGLGVVATGFDPLGVAGALVSTLSGAAGGWVSGAGYARAGGDDLIPPGATIVPRGPRPDRSASRGGPGRGRAG